MLDLKGLVKVKTEKKIFHNFHKGQDFYIKAQVKTDIISLLLHFFHWFPLLFKPQHEIGNALVTFYDNNISG